MDAKVVSPDEALFEGEVVSCSARSTEGEIGILEGHQPALLLLAPAPLELHLPDGSAVTYLVRSGFLEFADGQLTVLADKAERVDDKDAAFAKLEASQA
ncbi:ATP synthase F1 subunit epsilon [Euzebya tangerina]|uniref:ATP synthase F1 subunit epsilon n=1 Tax=Euzebya tangerina TaxID=591198 RepID=UPI000E324521|nr:ATP synthase F1 subunit epsilon [Euzebya tangerina]